MSESDWEKSDTGGHSYYRLALCESHLCKVQLISDNRLTPAWSVAKMGCFGRSETEEEKNLRERNKKIEKQIRDDKQKYKATHRLLLLGWLIIIYSV